MGKFNSNSKFNFDLRRKTVESLSGGKKRTGGFDMNSNKPVNDFNRPSMASQMSLINQEAHINRGINIDGMRKSADLQFNAGILSNKKHFSPPGLK